MPLHALRSSTRPRPRWLWLLLVAAFVALTVTGALFLRAGKVARSVSEEDSPAGADVTARAATLAPGAILPGTSPAQAAAMIAANGGGVATLGWGGGPGQLGRPEEDEGVAETPLRLTVDSAGSMLLLDAVNDRVVRLGADGKPLAELKLPFANPRDVGVAKDGTVLLLDGDPERGHVMLVGADGKPRGKLPLPPGTAASARGIVVSGNDVYAEALNGELTHLGNAQGVASRDPSTVPGRPTRDGRGFLSALIPDPDAGRVHVYVVDHPSREQRFSKLLSTGLLVEGIFLIDTSVAGTIYLGITGSVPGNVDGPTTAQLLCLEPERGEVLGVVDLPVNIGEEAILDAKALDSGGIAFSVFTKHGVRIERHDCR